MNLLLIILVGVWIVAALKKEAQKGSKTQNVVTKAPASGRPAPQSHPAQSGKRPAQAVRRDAEQKVGTQPCTHDEREHYSGSMHVDSHEGMDLGHVHSNRGHGKNKPGSHDAAVSENLLQINEEECGLDFDFSDSEQLVRSFVMQEILRRPGT